MRVLILVLIVAILVVIAGMASGFLRISQIRGGEVPQVAVSRSGVTAKGGQPPAFDVQTGSLKVGAEKTSVKVPTLVVQKPTTAQNQASANNSM